MNKITIGGRISRDPETKVVGDGVEMVTFSVAVNRYMGKDKPEATDFFECSVFGARGQAIQKYMHKGDQIFIVGQMTSNQVDKDGKKVTYWNVKVEEFDFGAKKGNGHVPITSTTTADGFNAAEETDELPF